MGADRDRRLREMAWRVVVGAGAGALVGWLLAGPAARLLMLLLRLTSPDAVRGVTSDDGFTIGRVSADSFGLFASAGFVGAAGGCVYVAARVVVPHRAARLAIWTALAAAVTGALIVHRGGVDFTLLEPTALAIGGFVALPALGALAIGLLVDRWADVRPGRDVRTAAIAIGAVAGAFALPAALAAFGVLVAADRLSGTASWPWVRGAVIAACLAAIALGAADLGRDIAALT